MHHDFEIKAYFKNGSLAMHTWHQGEHSRDMELAVFRERSDIGKIEVFDLRPANHRSRH